MLRVCVHTINGLENEYGGSRAGRAADPRFLELVTLMRRIQDAGGFGMRVKPEGDRQAVVLFFRSFDDPAVAGQNPAAK